MNLIDAEALEEDFYDNYDKKGYRNGKSLIYAAWCLLKKLIEKAPTIEAKPVVHAHWEKYDDSEFCYCSHCGEPAAEDDDVSWHGYCPVCGALMDENHIAGDGKKEPICGCPQEGVKIPVISMEDVPKLAKESD